jgi:flagellar hook-length control protein FliK
MPAAASDTSLRHTGRVSAEAEDAGTDGSTAGPSAVGAPDTADGSKVSGTGRESGNGAGADMRDKSKTEDGITTGTAAEQALSGTTFKDGTAPDISAAEKTAAVEKALNRFAEDLRSFRGGAQELKIVLEPESLGVLTISVTKTETGISAKIKSEDRDVVAAISDHLQKLISTIESRGIRLDDVDVVYSQAEQSGGFGQHGFSRGGDETPNNRYGPAFGRNQEPDTPEGDFWQGFYDDGGGGDTTVDYRV